MTGLGRSQDADPHEDEATTNQAFISVLFEHYRSLPARTPPSWLRNRVLSEPRRQLPADTTWEADTDGFPLLP